MANGGEQSTIDRNFSGSRAQFGLAEVAGVPAELPSWHSTDKATAILFLYKAQAHAHMATTGPRARKIFRNFVESNVAVNYFEQELHGTLQPHMQASHTGCLDDDVVIQIPKRMVFQPSHQKSSADGMRLYAIFPPA